MSNNVLVVEDNADLRDALRRYLQSHGFKVTAVDSTEDGIDAVDEQQFDIALIDINLPGKSGFSMIEYINEQDRTIPLIAMTARDGIEDKLHGFSIGVTDYIVKPFDLSELLARMKVHIRNAGVQDNSSEIITKTYRLNPRTWEFYANNEKIELTKTEFRIMHLLLMHNPAVVELQDLIEFVWGSGPDSVNPPIRIHIANLRKKIHDPDCSIIKTIPSIGYKLNDKDQD